MAAAARTLFDTGHPNPHSSAKVASVGMPATNVAAHFIDRVHSHGQLANRARPRAIAPAALPTAAPP
jgi:hypothetical protein